MLVAILVSGNSDPWLWLVGVGSPKLGPHCGQASSLCVHTVFQFMYILGICLIMELIGGVMALIFRNQVGLGTESRAMGDGAVARGQGECWPHEPEPHMATGEGMGEVTQG